VIKSENFKSGGDQNLLAEINKFHGGQGSMILVRIINKLSMTGQEVLRFSFSELEELDKFIPFTDDMLFANELSHWLHQFYNSKQVCAIHILSDMQGTTWHVVTERILGKLSLYIFGGGHVGQALALMAVLLGYEVTVIDDRVEFASRERFPDPRINLLVSDFNNSIDQLSIVNRSAAVIVTRGHQYDEICLRRLLEMEMSYLGMIGSKRRVISVFNKLKLQGFSADSLSKVHAPIGLRIGARSPQEIAVAILAEIIAEVNK